MTIPKERFLVKTPSPTLDWYGGTWYDPTLLPKIDQSYNNVENNKLCETLCEKMWDVITKSYDAEKDTFIYRRSTNRLLRVDHSNKTKVWKFDLPTDLFRIVAIMPQPSWQEMYEGRLTGRDLNTEAVALHTAIDRALGSPSNEE